MNDTPEVYEHTCSPDGNMVDCDACGVRDCPWGEPMHYHHDGCPSCDVGGGAEPTTFPQAMAEVKRLNVEISEIEENYDARGTQIQDFVSAWGCSADFVDEMLNDSDVGLGEAIGWAREALASALGLPDRGGDLHALAVRAASEIERLKGDQDLLRDVVHHRDELMRERDEAQAAWAGVTEQWKHALGKLDEATEEIATLRLALGTQMDAQVLSPLSVRPAEPMLICPSCQCAWPELTTGHEDTVTCACGKVLGCKSRRKP